MCLQVEGNGDCMFESFRKQMIFKEDEEEKYAACHLRRQCIVHFLRHCGEEEYKDWIIKQVRHLYGSGEEGGLGPFSVKTYLHYMLEDGSWGDNIMLQLIASMWGVRISILLSDTCAEIRLRHNMEWPECDFGLIFNCNSKTGHYSGVKRIDETGVECKHVKEGEEYSMEEDKMVKFENSVPSGMVLISVSKLQSLLRDSALAAKVREVVNDERSGWSGKSNVGSDVDISSREGAKKVDKNRKEVEIDEDLQEVQRGDVHCVRCNKDFDNTPKLKKHVQLYHKNIYLNCCDICKKGFNTLDGLRAHEKIHKGTLIKCDECQTTFTTDRAKKRHMRDKHGEKKELKCSHCGHISYTPSTLYLHVKCCPHNPNRIPIYCELCTKGPWYTGSKLLAHKRKDHNWK